MQDFIDQDFGNEEDMFRNTGGDGNEQGTNQQTGGSSASNAEERRDDPEVNRAKKQRICAVC